MTSPQQPEAPPSYAIREIFRHGRYAMCQVLTGWKQAPPKYIVCHDPHKGDQFVAKQAMGTWCEADLTEVLAASNRARGEADQRYGNLKTAVTNYVLALQRQTDEGHYEHHLQARIADVIAAMKESAPVAGMAVEKNDGV